MMCYHIPMALPSVVVNCTVTSLSRSGFLFSTNSTTVPASSSTSYVVGENPICTAEEERREAGEKVEEVMETMVEMEALNIQLW